MTAMSATVSHGLRRYMIDITVSGFPKMVESQDGGWYRVDDVQSLLLKIKIIMDETKQRIANGETHA